MIDLFENVWSERSEIVVDHCGDITLPVRYPFSHAFLRLYPSQYPCQIALFVIGVAGCLCPFQSLETHVSVYQDLDVESLGQMTSPFLLVTK